MIYLILVGYVLIVFLGSLRGASKQTTTPEGYFLADRNFKTLTLFFTVLATNFSAFYFLGFAGAGYRIGYAHFVIMALGTGFAGISFYLIGTKVWKWGKAHGAITPAELIYQKTGSHTLRWIFVIVMLLFTFPYLALQIVGAGYILENLTQGEIPYLSGAILLTLFTIVYVWIGGMQSVARTDLKQGLLMIVLMLGAVIVISHDLGGLSYAHEKVHQIKPELFDRTGPGEAFPPGRWFSLLIFWIFCIPMFPQIFMRFYVAKDVETLKYSALWYALIPVFISLFPVIIGVLGHLTFPELQGKETDQILPKMLVVHSPEWFSGLVMVGALAAFMSTLDSQLLSLSTIITRDVVLPFRKGMDMQAQVKAGRVCVVILALVGLAIAARPFDTIDDMGRLAFGGLAVLFPVAWAILQNVKFKPVLGTLSVFAGESVLIGLYYNLIPNEWTLGLDHPIAAIIVSFLVLGIGKVIAKR